jgi:phosphoglycolate phosphatase-like HAD superfamily hydrolase
MAGLFREHIPPLPGETEAALQQLLLGDILSLNGQPSIFQMRRAAERAVERGERGLDPEILLLEYQRRLEAAIAERIGTIQSGRLPHDEFVVHGARELLERLKARGLTLIILSGTSEPRVKEEAALLGLAGYFGRHIYGGTADLAQSSKRAVIERLLREEKIGGAQLLSFGDGPVEIRLTKEFGGLAVGVASDEEMNGSGRMHPQKLSALREAGADAVVADYRDADLLLDRIFGK